MNAVSRTSNPFATCWTNPRVVDYLSLAGDAPEDILRRLADHNWRGQIVGPHGSGKSTLLGALAPLIARQRGRWVRVNLHSERQRGDWDRLQRLELAADMVLVIDGCEQLSMVARGWIAWRTHLAGCGYVITAHRPVGLPILASLAPDIELVSALFQRLVKQVSSPVTEIDLCNAFNACNGNIRDTWFHLYDLHEKYVRQGHVANRMHVDPVDICGGK